MLNFTIVLLRGLYFLISGKIGCFAQCYLIEPFTKIDIIEKRWPCRTSRSEKIWPITSSQLLIWETIRPWCWAFGKTPYFTMLDVFYFHAITQTPDLEPLRLQITVNLKLAEIKPFSYIYLYLECTLLRHFLYQAADSLRPCDRSSLQAVLDDSKSKWLLMNTDRLHKGMIY